MRKFVATAAMVALSVGVGVTSAEVFLRLLLASESSLGKRLRRPGIYADWSNGDDYWKLDRRFGAGPPSWEPHPLLGNVGRFDRASLRHLDAAAVGERRPVLLYGDSFAACVKSLCFEEILNGDPEFAREHYLLNYGVVGYGLDQIYLLFENTLDLYRDPLVVVSLMTTDLDRTILTVRRGPKPYFVVRGEELQLRGVPIDPDPQRFFDANPPEIWLYSLRLLMHQRWFPSSLRDAWMGEREMRARKQAVSGRLIEQMVARLRREHVPFVFLIFQPQSPPHGSLDGADGWRERFLRRALEGLAVDVIWAKELYRQDTRRRRRPLWHYIDERHGHPTSYFNIIVARAIERALLSRPGAGAGTQGGGKRSRTTTTRSSGAADTSASGAAVSSARTRSPG